MDYDFIETYDLDVAWGRPFSKEYSTDRLGAFILNERATRTIGSAPDDAVNKKLLMSTGGDSLQEGTIIGVVRDFHLQTLAHENPAIPVFARPGGGYEIYLRSNQFRRFKRHNGIYSGNLVQNIPG